MAAVSSLVFKMPLDAVEPNFGRRVRHALADARKESAALVEQAKAQLQ